MKSDTFCATYKFEVKIRNFPGFSLKNEENKRETPIVSSTTKFPLFILRWVAASVFEISFNSSSFNYYHPHYTLTLHSQNYVSSTHVLLLLHVQLLLQFLPYLLHLVCLKPIQWSRTEVLQYRHGFV